VFEDFYDSIGQSLDAYCDHFTGSWHIGMIRALQSQGVTTRVFYSSTLVRRSLVRTHRPTGTAITFLPAPKVYRAIHRRMVHPYKSFGYWSDVEVLFGACRGWRRRWYSALYLAAPYLAAGLLRLAREIRRSGCEAILCQDYEHAGFDRAVLLGSLARRPVFAIFQGGTADWNPVGRRIRSWSTRRCAGFIVASSAERARLSAVYGIGDRRLHQIFNALDDSAFEPAERKPARALLGVPEDAQVVVWHGRVEMFIKGLDVLLDSWNRVCAERPGRATRLVLLGDGQSAAELREAISCLPPGRVTWIDRFESDRRFIRSLLAAADVYVFPSRIEGQASAPVEAMAAGLPVVAAAAIGMRDIFIDGEASGGVLVPPGDPVALAEALGRLLDDEGLRRALSAAGRRRAEQFRGAVVGGQLRSVFFPSMSDLAPTHGLGA